MDIVDGRVYRGLLIVLTGTSLPGRAARGSVSPRKVICQVPASD
jgi:hypothetical protein